MAHILYTEPLTQREKLKILRVLDTSSHFEATGCKNWTKELTRDGYPVFRTTFRGKRMWVRAHRITYYIAHECAPIEAAMHISHICHNKSCVNPQHLNKETQNINNNRNICKREGACHGHFGHPQCIL